MARAATDRRFPNCADRDPWRPQRRTSDSVLQNRPPRELREEREELRDRLDLRDRLLELRDRLEELRERLEDELDQELPHPLPEDCVARTLLIELIALDARLAASRRTCWARTGSVVTRSSPSARRDWASEARDRALMLA